MQIKGKKRSLVQQFKYSVNKKDIAEITEIETFISKISEDVEGGYLIEQGLESVDNVDYEYVVVKLYIKNKD